MICFYGLYAPNLSMLYRHLLIFRVHLRLRVKFVDEVKNVVVGA